MSSVRSETAEVPQKYFLRSRKRSFESVAASTEDIMNKKEVETVVISSGDEDARKESPKKCDTACSKKCDTACSVEPQLECAICLQICVHPTRLPCRHIFCFLCVKGVIHGSKCCAMCRQPIPLDYLENPDLVEMPSVKAKLANEEDDYKWFYEGRNGWWQYDWRTCAELESAYHRGDRKTEILIAGYLYTVDFSDMVQYRKIEVGRRRNIKRDLASCPKKGIAGIHDPGHLAEAMDRMNLD